MNEMINKINSLTPLDDDLTVPFIKYSEITTLDEINNMSDEDIDKLIVIYNTFRTNNGNPIHGILSRFSTIKPITTNINYI